MLRIGQRSGRVRDWSSQLEFLPARNLWGAWDETTKKNETICWINSWSGPWCCFYECQKKNGILKMLTARTTPKIDLKGPRFVL
jgi:hypothetical protein